MNWFDQCASLGMRPSAAMRKGCEGVAARAVPQAQAVWTLSGFAFFLLASLLVCAAM